MTGLAVLCGYLLGFTITGRLVARWPEVDLDDGVELLAVACCALMWPLLALWLGGEKALRWFFGGAS